MSEALFLGIDFGTQSVRVGVIDCRGNILSEAEAAYQTTYPQSGWATQRPQDWWDSFILAGRKVTATLDLLVLSRIRSVTVCATSSSVLMLDSLGQAIDDCMLWMDIRSSEQARRINATKSLVLRGCGGEVSPEWFLPKVLWLKENQKSDYDRAWIILEQLDYINYRLSGELCGSRCNAVCKWNYDAESGFDSEFMHQIGLPDYKQKLVMQIIPLGGLIGRVSLDVLADLGLPQIPVNLYQGGIDAHVAMYGMGVVQPNQMAMIMGTSFVQFVLSNQESQMGGIWGPYKGAMAGPEYLLECGQISAGSLVKWFKQISQIHGENPYDVMMKEAEAIPAGSDGLRALDYFQGNRTPHKNPEARGVFFGLTLQHTRAHLYRALLESVACGTRQIIENLEKNGTSIDQVTVCGGVTKDPLWMQIIADVTGKNLVINHNTHAGGILGGALIGAVGEGIYRSFKSAADAMTHEKTTIRSDSETHLKYQQTFHDYNQLYKLLEPMMHLEGTHA